MRRLFLFAGVVILGTSWCGAARAQFGIPGFGNTTDVNGEIEAQRSKIKQQIKQYTKPQARSSRPTASRPGSQGSADRFGRVILPASPSPATPQSGAI